MHKVLFFIILVGIIVQYADQPCYVRSEPWAGIIIRGVQIMILRFTVIAAKTVRNKLADLLFYLDQITESKLPELFIKMIKGNNILKGCIICIFSCHGIDKRAFVSAYQRKITNIREHTSGRALPYGNYLKIKGGPSGPPAVPVLTSIWNLVTIVSIRISGDIVK